MALTVVSRGRKHLIERDSAWAPGRHRATFTLHDQHYYDGSAWQPVNELLSDDATDGYVKACTTTRHIFRVGNGGERRWYPRREVPTEYVSVTNIQWWRTTGGGSWRNLNLPTPAWRATGADWDLPNLSASITHTWRRIKADFTLKDSSAPTRLRFAITLVGLTLGADWQFRNAADEVVGRIDKTTAEDATGASVPATATYAGGYIEWSVDTTGATFPVTVDPTFTDGYGGDVTTSKDTGVTSGNATYNRGAMTEFWTAYESKGLIEFDLSSLSGTCDSASLYLYRSTAESASTFTVRIYSIASGNAAWIEGTQVNALAGAGEPCWNALAADGAGGVTTAWAGSAGLGTSGTDYVATELVSFSSVAESAAGTEYGPLALTASVVEGWFGGGTNYGMVFWPAVWAWHRFATSDHATTGYRPKLVVEYTEAGGGPVIPVFMNAYRQYWG